MGSSYNPESPYKVGAGSKRQIREFILLTLSDLQYGISKGYGDKLHALYELLAVDNTTAMSALVKLRAISANAAGDPIKFSDLVFEYFVVPDSGGKVMQSEPARQLAARPRSQV